MLEIAREFGPETKAAIVIKHNNVCGLAIGRDIAKCLQLALDTDRVSAFGGVIVLNGKVDKDILKIIDSLFLEVLAAPEFDQDFIDHCLKHKPRLKIIRYLLSPTDQPLIDRRALLDGYLLQSTNNQLFGTVKKRYSS